MKKAPAKMKKKSMAKMAKKSPMKKPLVGKQKNLPEDLKKAILDSPAKKEKPTPKQVAMAKAILGEEKSVMKMKKAAMKLKKDGVMMMKKAAMKMKKVSAMKMKMKKK